jgi:hypothetical protein
VICHSDDDPEVAEGEEEESVVAEAAKKQIPRAQSGHFGMTTQLNGVTLLRNSRKQVSPSQLIDV